MHPKPRISIVTPVLNGAEFLRQTLNSVRALDYPGLEYIVCDGGSTDGTLGILEENRDLISQLIVEKDSGMYDALARGFSRATGDVLGWIGSDDLLMPWSLNCVSSYLAQEPQCQWLTGVPAMVDAEGRLLWMAQVAPRYRRAWIKRRWYSPIGLGIIQQECTFFKRELYEKAGGLKPCAWMKNAGDFDLWCRFARHAELHQIGILLAAYRMHARNLTGDGSNYFRESGAVRIPGGKVVGYTYSYLRFLWSCFRRTPRLADFLPRRANP